MTHRNEALTAVCALLREYEMPPEEVADMACDLAGEYQATLDAERGKERENEDVSA